MVSSVFVKESGPKGSRCVCTLYARGQRKRVWKSSWQNTGNDKRDFYLATMEMQTRIRLATEAGTIPR